MGLLEQEIKELRDMNKKLIDKQITPEEVQTRLSIYSQTEKRAKMMLQVFALSAKHGKRVQTTIERSNLIGENAQIDMGGDDENEVVDCPALEQQITRCECLDFSGASNCHEECDGCENFEPTRRKLLGDA